VPAENVRKLFLRSGLSQAVLMQIYEAASSKQKNYLDKKEFYKGLKIIGICQQWGSISGWEELVGSAKVRLPEFQEEQAAKSPVEARAAVP
jgi:hypothetical protein